MSSPLAKSQGAQSVLPCTCLSPRFPFTAAEVSTGRDVICLYDVGGSRVMEYTSRTANVAARLSRLAGLAAKKCRIPTLHHHQLPRDGPV